LLHERKPPTGSPIHHWSLLFKDISKAAEDDTGKADKKSDEEEESQKKVAATKIQAAFRGHHARKSLRIPEASSARTGTLDEAISEEAASGQLQKEFPDDTQGELALRSRTSPINALINPALHPTELRDAATKIQATFRGHMSRKEQAAAAVKSAMDIVESAGAKIEEKVSSHLDECLVRFASSFFSI